MIKVEVHEDSLKWTFKSGLCDIHVKMKDSNGLPECETDDRREQHGKTTR